MTNNQITINIINIKFHIVIKYLLYYSFYINLNILAFVELSSSYTSKFNTVAALINNDTDKIKSNSDSSI